MAKMVRHMVNFFRVADRLQERAAVGVAADAHRGPALVMKGRRASARLLRAELTIWHDFVLGRAVDKFFAFSAVSAVGIFERKSVRQSIPVIRPRKDEQHNVLNTARALDHSRGAVLEEVVLAAGAFAEISAASQHALHFTLNFQFPVIGLDVVLLCLRLAVRNQHPAACRTTHGRHVGAPKAPLRTHGLAGDFFAAPVAALFALELIAPALAVVAQANAAFVWI